MTNKVNKDLIVILSLLLALPLSFQLDKSNAAAEGITDFENTTTYASFSSSTVPQQQPSLKLLPVDEASQDPAFEKFRDQLLTAAYNHDRTFVKSVLDKHILNSLGGSGGIKEFEERWNLDRGGDELWITLTQILSQGGSFSDEQGERQFCAPYVNSKWREVYSLLPSESDPSDFEVIIGSKVDLRAAPSEESRILTTLSYDVVRVLSHYPPRSYNAENNPQWVKISTITGTQGYIETKDIKSPSDHYACFKKVGLSWRMIALAAGE
jgi:hypothetical protein